MLITALILGLLGLCLSAMFSGSETAFYRIPKLRLKLDAMAGESTANRLLWLVNHPGMFVATILVGNNVANYTVSTATVLLVGATLPQSEGVLAEIASTLLLAPFLFIYGEMFPKYLCLHAPNRMLKRLAPILLFFYRLFLPITAVLWIVNHLLAKILGQSQEMLRLTLGRQELVNVLDEGQEVGILFDAQRRLAAGIFEISGRSITDWVIPLSQWPVVTTKMKPKEVLELAKQSNRAELPVLEVLDDETPTPGQIPIGFVRVIDLEMATRNRLDESARQLLQLLQTELPIRSAVEISSRHSLLTSMILMQTLNSSFGCVINEQRQCLGYVLSDQLRDTLLSSSAAH